MKRLNQRGDAALYIISVAVVIAMIGFAGWRVWQTMEESKKDTTTSSTQTSEQAPAETVNDLEEQKVEGTDLTFYYPITQGPATIVTNTDEMGGGERPSKIAAYKLKDYIVEVSSSANTRLELGLTGLFRCKYDVKADTLVAEEPERTRDCNFPKKTVAGVEFYDTSLQSEALILNSFVAPTSGNKYVVSLFNLSGSPTKQCYGRDYNEAVCEQQKKDLNAALSAQVGEFVAANPNLF